MVRWCPRGHGKFDDKITHCPTCQQQLTTTKPKMSVDDRPQPKAAIVYLATAPNEITAQMWAEMLRDAGIQAMVKPLGPGMGAWASVATMEHALYVLESRYSDARDLISGLEGLGYEDDEQNSPFNGPRH